MPNFESYLIAFYYASDPPDKLRVWRLNAESPEMCISTFTAFATNYHPIFHGAQLPITVVNCIKK
jgi:hypothetical protein